MHRSILYYRVRILTFGPGLTLPQSLLLQATEVIA